jgi:Uri superfamily endonuclease
MELFLYTFTGSILFSFVGIYFYVRSERTMYHEVRRKLSEIEAKYRMHEDLIHSNIGTITTNNMKVKYCEEKVMALSDEVDVVHDHLSRVREMQMKLREQLSNKKKTVRLEVTPEVLTAFKGKAKELNKKIKDLKL